jgi:hypothetical protein
MDPSKSSHSQHNLEDLNQNSSSQNEEQSGGFGLKKHTGGAKLSSATYGGRRRRKSRKSRGSRKSKSRKSRRSRR